jgi:hypothetical protein
MTLDLLDPSGSSSIPSKNSGCCMRLRMPIAHRMMFCTKLMIIRCIMILLTFRLSMFESEETVCQWLSNGLKNHFVNYSCCSHLKFIRYHYHLKRGIPTTTQHTQGQVTMCR